MDNQGLTGKVIWYGDPGYEQARKEYNRAINKFPLGIAYCCNQREVANAILWARKNDVEIRIRSGGHHYEGYSIGTGCLVIDTSLMNAIDVDTENNLVRVQAGTSLKRLYEVLYQNGYVFPGGTCPTVAISGLVLGGGIGLSMRYLGLTVDSLVEVEMVDAQGEKIIANRWQNSDLFWALRGAGGGNFGVVTAYTFKLLKKAEYITLIQLEWDNNQPARYKFLYTWQKWLEGLDRRMSSFARVYKQGVRLIAFFYGTPDEAKEVLEPLLRIPGITLASIEYVSFIDAVNIIGSTYPPSEKFSDTGRYVYKNLTVKQLKHLIAILDQAPTEYLSRIKVYSLGGAVQDVKTSQTAVFYRDARYIMAISSSWEKDNEAFINRVWVFKGFRYIRRITAGSYANFPYRFLINYEKAYFGGYRKRLQCIKTKYDPMNVFRFPQSIHPDDECK